jgi:hypothetical protein
MAGLSPTQRTLAAMREQGRLVGSVEKFNPFAGPHGKRQDLFGFIDLIALDPEDGIIGIQSCGQDFAGHIRKMTGERNENMFAWLKHGKVELWGWRKVKLRRGMKAMRWRARIADFWIEGDEIKWEERKK